MSIVEATVDRRLLREGQGEDTDTRRSLHATTWVPPVTWRTPGAARP